MGRRPFVGFPRCDFAQTSRIFWNNGYRTVGQVRDMGLSGMGRCLHETKRDARGGRSMLSHLPLALKISPRLEPNGRTMADNIPFNEVFIGGRMGKWAMDLPRTGSCIEPDQDMVDFFSAQPEIERAARPTMSPYVVTDSLGAYPWLPSDGPTRRRSGNGETDKNLLTDLRATGMFRFVSLFFNGIDFHWPAILRIRGRIPAAWYPGSASSRKLRIYPLRTTLG